MQSNVVSQINGAVTGKTPWRPVNGPLAQAQIEPCARRDAAMHELAGLRRRLRRERAMGRCGHWGYDLARHLALTQMVKEAEAACRRAALGPLRAGIPA